MSDIYITFDTEVDVVYVRFRALEPGERVARTVHIDEFRNVDYDAAGEPIGVEFLCATNQLVMEGLPRQDEIRAALRRLPVPA